MNPSRGPGVSVTDRPVAASAHPSSAVPARPVGFPPPVEPGPSRAARRFRRVTWAAALVSILGFAAAFLWPQTFLERLPRAVAWTGLLALARMLSFEIGLGLIGAGLASTFLCRGIQAPLALAASGVLWLSPLGYAMVRRPGPCASDRPAVRLMTFNILFRNHQFNAIASEVLRHNPDLVTFTEYTAAAEADLRPLLSAAYPYRVVAPFSRGHAVAIFSRLPIIESSVLPFERSTRSIVRAAVEHDGQRVDVLGVHLSSPFGFAGLRAGRDEFNQLRRVLQQSTHPAIVMGDFNASILGPQDEALRTLGWTSSWSTERGYGATWPAQGQLHRAMSVRIDHIYAPEAMGCTASQVGRPCGSDHRPVIADFVWRE